MVAGSQHYFQPFSRSLSISAPAMLLSSEISLFAQPDTQLAVFQEGADFGGKLLNVLRVAQYDAVRSVLDDLAGSRF